MNDFIFDAILYDHYSELLNEHSREVFGAYLSEDLSLSEVAERFDMTRQGASDLIRRSRLSLKSYEEALGLIRRFKAIEEELDRISEASERLKDPEAGIIRDALDRIRGEL